MYFHVLEFLVSGMRSGLRGRSIQVTFVLGLVLIGFAYLAASFSPRQPHTIALDIGFSAVRFTLVLLVLFWVQELITREIDRKIILHSLALPVSRAAYLVGRFLAVVSLAAISTVILGFCLMLAVFLANPYYEQEFPVALGFPYWLTLTGLLIDVAVVTAFALAIAVISTVPVLPLALGAGFAIAGKALGASVEYLARGADGDQNLTASINPFLDIVRAVIPDLSRLDWRDGALYGVTQTTDAMVWAVLMAVSYMVLMVGLGIVSFRRKEFS